MRHVHTLAASTTLLVVLVGCSSHESGTHVSGATRTIDVTMVDNTFKPDKVQVKKGETVAIRFLNNGSTRHEAVIGDAAVQSQHHREMAASTAPKPPGSEHMDGGAHGDDATSVTVEAGQAATLTHTFDETGTIVIGCHEPGHWEAGMKADVAIT